MRRTVRILVVALLFGCGPGTPPANTMSGTSNTSAPDENWIFGVWYLGPSVGESGEQTINFEFLEDGSVVPSGDLCGSFATAAPGTWVANPDGTVTVSPASGEPHIAGFEQLVFRTGETCDTIVGDGGAGEMLFRRGMACVQPMPCDGPGECACGEIVWCGDPPQSCE